VVVLRRVLMRVVLCARCCVCMWAAYRTIGQHRPAQACHTWYSDDTLHTSFHPSFGSIQHKYLDIQGRIPSWPLQLNVRHVIC
jgi:hypothetical protein